MEKEISGQRGSWSVLSLMAVVLFAGFALSPAPGRATILLIDNATGEACAPTFGARINPRTIFATAAGNISVDPWLSENPTTNAYHLPAGSGCIY